MTDDQIKNPDLCERCRYSDELCEAPRSCTGCKQHINAPTILYLCRCDTVKDGTVCKYFEEAEE